MTTMDLIQINPQGRPATEVGRLNNIARQVCAATTLLYTGSGFVAPWVGYLAQCEGKIVGACAFKAPPADGKVEIGYFTFPDWEGQGIATAMVRKLLSIVQQEQPQLTVVARTANEENASNTILRKLGFTMVHLIDDTGDGEMLEWQLANNDEVMQQDV